MVDQPAGTLFLGASIPTREKWDGQFDPLEITDAVVALARTFLSADWELVTAVHPTIAPLLLYVDAELPEHQRSRIVIYQSELFEDLPEATQRFIDGETARVVKTPAVPGDVAEFGGWDASLLAMRRQMFAETEPDAAVFVGGMEGIFHEFELFAETRPGRPRFALGGPGGAARALGATTNRPAIELADELRDEVVYPHAARRVLAALQEQRPQ